MRNAELRAGWDIKLTFSPQRKQAFSLAITGKSAVTGSKALPWSAKPTASARRKKPHGFVGERRPASGRIFPETARLTAAYNLQISLHRKANSAGKNFPTGTEQTRDHNFSCAAGTLHFSFFI